MLAAQQQTTAQSKMAETAPSSAARLALRMGHQPVESEHSMVAATLLMLVAVV